MIDEAKEKTKFQMAEKRAQAKKAGDKVEPDDHAAVRFAHVSHRVSVLALLCDCLFLSCPLLNVVSSCLVFESAQRPLVINDTCVCACLAHFIHNCHLNSVNFRVPDVVQGASRQEYKDALCRIRQAQGGTGKRASGN